MISINYQLSDDDNVLEFMTAKGPDYADSFMEYQPTRLM